MWQAEPLDFMGTLNAVKKDRGIEEGPVKQTDSSVREIKKKIKALRLALEEGENSQIVEDFDPAAHLESLHRKHL